MVYGISLNSTEPGSTTPADALRNLNVTGLSVSSRKVIMSHIAHHVQSLIIIS